MDPNLSSDDLQGHIRQARHDLDVHSREMVARARAELDWRNFVAKHPLVSLGAAAAAGFFLALRSLRCHIVQTKAGEGVSAEHTVKAAAPTAPRTAGLVATLASTIAAVLVREGAGLAARLAMQMIDSARTGAREGAATASTLTREARTKTNGARR